jgi:RNA polymerase sigma-70 factor (ECF subfamily)
MTAIETHPGEANARAPWAPGGAFARPLAMPSPSDRSDRTSPDAAARFRRMADDHFAIVWRFLRGLGVPSSAADDAAQQVFVAAARRIDDIVPGSERAFLFATARGVARNARRATARRREVQDDDALALLHDEASDPEAALASGQARALLDRLLAEIGDDAREVFVLFELEGMTMAAIAESLGLPPGTVASRLRRAREEFESATKRFRARGEGR